MKPKSPVDSVARLQQANRSLRLRTVELTDANRRLRGEVLQRKSAERSLRKSEEKHRRLLMEARVMQLRLRHLSHQVLLAQEEERKEISRELHDEVVQTLTGINVQLASLKIESGLGKAALSKHISYTQRLVERSVNIVHRFARDLRPAVLDDLGLIPAMQTYLKIFTEQTGLRVRFVAFAEIEKMSNEKRTVLYRVALAALNNVAKHARASAVSVVIRGLPAAVLMQIKDDGRAFDSGRMLDARNNKRLGLIGMRERVEMVGGEFHIDSTRGVGTMIEARLPWNRREAA